MPFPADMGDKVYSGHLAKALADAGADLTFVGLQPENGIDPPSDWPLKWSIVPGRRRSAVRSVLSTMPVVAASYATPAYKSHVRALMRSNWDFVVLDQFALGWALQIVKSENRSFTRPLIVHVSHNHETTLWRSFYRDFCGSIPRRFVLWQNYLKVRALERMLVAQADLLTAITDEDAARFEQDRPDVRTVVVTPGYIGGTSSRLKITEQTPRRVVLVGSFKWAVKQENLRQFVRLADPVFAEHDIEFLVVGGMPQSLVDELTRNTAATRIAGYVDELEPVLATARIAVVPEAIGGGFKLKFLDYVFGRVPVATLTSAAAGVPVEIRQHMLCRETLVELAYGIADLIDNISQLNAMQESALCSAISRFRWSDRGRAMLNSIRTAKGARNI